MSELPIDTEQVWRCEDCRQANDENLRTCDFCGAPRPLTHRGEVMNSPASAAEGAEVGNLNMPQRHGLGASPQGMEAQATQPSAAPSCGLQLGGARCNKPKGHPGAHELEEDFL